MIILWQMLTQIKVCICLKVLSLPRSYGRVPTVDTSPVKWSSIPTGPKTSSHLARTKRVLTYYYIEICCRVVAVAARAGHCWPVCTNQSHPNTYMHSLHPFIVRNPPYQLRLVNKRSGPINKPIFELILKLECHSCSFIIHWKHVHQYNLLCIPSL